MKDFNYYLKKVGEIGFVEESVHSLAYVSGLPEAHPNELVVFENQEIGRVFSLSPESVEVLLLSGKNLRVGSKVVRTGEFLTFAVGEGLLGRVLDPLGRFLDGKQSPNLSEFRPVDVLPPKLTERRDVVKQMETGVSIVDLVVPIGKGQRELIIGDRKTGKTEFLQQTILTQARNGTVCIYAVIGQKFLDIVKFHRFSEEKGISKNTIIIASSSSSPAGLTFLVPYAAMTVAEFFRDKGRDVLIVLDDMTTHARTCREISLLARRFPGRGSYPGDIFYLHAKIVERAGNFEKGSITCLPVAESVLGDLSGYIQTNLMAMTDGHIFFDIELFNQGKRPAINPFLSVTRVGHQTQTPLQQNVSRELLSFLVKYEKMKEFLHFGAEVGDEVKKILSLGQRLDAFFYQESGVEIPINFSIFILAALWAGIFSEESIETFNLDSRRLISKYSQSPEFRKAVDELVLKSFSFSELVLKLRRNKEIITLNIGV